MENSCRKYLETVDAQLDGELARDEAHPAACAPCRAERDSRAALKRALSTLPLTPAPRRVTMASLSPARRWGWTAAAAAVLVGTLVLLSLPAPLPEVVALSIQMHDDYLSGRITPHDIGLKISIPGADYVGQCACPPSLGPSSPFIIYRKGQTPISLLIAETEPRDLPASARRSLDGRPYHLFKAGPNRVLVYQSGKLCTVWVSRLEESDLVATILATKVGRELFQGERVTLEGIS